MPFGGFCPFPLRLGGSVKEGWSPEQQARMAADVTAMVRSAPFALLTYTLDSTFGIITIHSYEAQHGRGVPNAPTPAINGVGDVTWTWAASYQDDYGGSAPTNIRGAKATVLRVWNAGPATTEYTPRSVRVRTFRLWGIPFDHPVSVIVK